MYCFIISNIVVFIVITLGLSCDYFFYLQIVNFLNITQIFQLIFLVLLKVILL